jgi:lipopolysaccharide cholinephosphotransferase
MAIDTPTIEKAHVIMLDILVTFDAICQKHNLHYWLDAGTLLGAVRHKGFIPWDDDVDISMPVEDYNTFKTLAQAELSQTMFLQHKESDVTFPFDYMKIRDSRATIIEFHEEGKEVAYNQGLFLDIFPMLAIKNTTLNHLWYKFSFEMIRFFSAKKYRQDFLRGLFVKSLHKMHVDWEQTHTKIIYGGEMPDVAKWYDHNGIFPLEKDKFENLNFSFPSDCNAYLSELYGRYYMEIPPKEKQTIHAAKIKLNE